MNETKEIKVIEEKIAEVSGNVSSFNELLRKIWVLSSKDTNSMLHFGENHMEEWNKLGYLLSYCVKEMEDMIIPLTDDRSTFYIKISPEEYNILSAYDKILYIQDRVIQFCDHFSLVWEISSKDPTSCKSFVESYMSHWWPLGNTFMYIHRKMLALLEILEKRESKS